MKISDLAIRKLRALVLGVTLGLYSVQGALPAAAAIRQIPYGSMMRELDGASITRSTIVDPFRSSILYGMPSNPPGTPVALVSCNATYLGPVHEVGDPDNTYTYAIHLQIFNRTNIFFDETDAEFWFEGWSGRSKSNGTSATEIVPMKNLKPREFREYTVRTWNVDNQFNGVYCHLDSVQAHDGRYIELWNRNGANEGK